MESSDRRNHLTEEDGKHPSVSVGDAESNRDIFYTLPRIRYTTLVQTVLVLDLVSSVALWVCGGDGNYLIKSIEHFMVRDSVFDLAVLGFCRGSVLFFIFAWLEDVTLKQIDQPYEQQLSSRKCQHHCTALFLSIASLAYSITKGILVYEVRSETQHHMHSTYYALVISSVVCCFLESCFAVMSFRAMRRLKLQRILHADENDDKDKKKKRRPSLRRLIILAKQESGILAIASVALLLSSGTSIAVPYFFGKVIQSAVSKGMAQLNKTVFILLGIYVVGAISAMVRAWLFTLAGQRLVARIRTMLFNAIMKQEVAFFDTTRTGELINRLSSDTQVIQNALTVNVSMLLRYSLQILGSFIFMFTLSPKLTGVLISMIPIVGVGAQQYGKLVQNLRKKFQDELASASTTSEECISNIRTVKSFSQESKSMRSYAEDIDKSYKIGSKLALLTGGFQGIIGIFAQGAVVVVLWYGGKLVNEKEMNVGVLTAFMLYTLNVAMAFAFLSSLYGDFMQAVGASIRMFELMDRIPTISMEGGRTLPTVNQTIEFHNVCFHYPSRPETDVLKGMSFNIEPGETVALVGPSGGGKSTVISLLERFYDPISGRITIGDADVFTLDLHWLRKKIGLVSQEPVLFAFTIAANIAYGRDASQEEIEDAARQANAHDFIMSFEKGYETEVGERGVKLSGGQKQRIAIARALLLDPDILLLDEATSALDAESEHFVKEAIDRAMKNRTVLVIAHRLSTVRNAQQVLVIEKGQIVERGTHKGLLAQDGVYKKLVLRQLSTMEGEGVGLRSNDRLDESLLEL